MAIDCNYPPPSYDPPALTRRYDDYERLPLGYEVDEYITALDKELTKEPVIEIAPKLTLGDKFLGLADKWSRETRSISSTSDITSHPSYQEIVRLGWDVVPLLLNDLQRNQRFWFPALYQITKVRPFDQTDAGNSKRMLKAWIMWGKRKGLI